MSNEKTPAENTTAVKPKDYIIRVVQRDKGINGLEDSISFFERRHRTYESVLDEAEKMQSDQNVLYITE